MPPPDEFDIDTLIQDVMAVRPPTPEAGPRPQPSPPEHRVLWFALTLGLFQVDGILLYLFLWLLLHG